MKDYTTTPTRPNNGLILDEVPITDEQPASTNGDFDSLSNSLIGAAKPVKKRISTRENIERLVREGAQSYPSYLKLVHTGESDFSDISSDDDLGRSTESKVSKVKTRNNKQSVPGVVIDGIKDVRLEDAADRAERPDELSLFGEWRWSHGLNRHHACRWRKQK